MPTIDKFKWKKDENGNTVMYIDESGVEKLIELLNEYETPRSGVVYKSYDDYDGFFYGVDCDGETEIAWSDSLICSKKFGFILWLVENDKIDLGNKMLGIEWSILDNYGYENGLLMLLSISDTPIEDLISYLR